MKTWLKVKLSASPVMVESISDFAVGVMGAGVEIGEEDAADVKILNVYLQQENPSSQMVKDSIRQLTLHVEELAAIFKVEPPRITWEILEEQDWAKDWKKHFAPLLITERIVIVPTWEDYRPADHEKVLVMDPGMAFGTGHHATTSLVLTMIEEHIEEDGLRCSVLDVGTGTGILGMAAAILGADPVLGIDNDPVAVAAAIENIELNGLTDRVKAAGTPLSAVEDSYSLVVANIVHDVLQEMAEDLWRVTEAGGQLILSGVLAGNQAASLTARFTENKFRFLEERQKGEWAALLFRKEQ